VYNLVKGTSAINIFIGITFIYVAYIIINAFELHLLSSILGKFVNVGVIVIMIVFQQDKLKNALYRMYRDPVNHETWSKFWERWNSEMGPLVFVEEKKEEKDA
jgi:DNA integrity scanning protein DisA with diadenylate cyclase activity